MTAYVNGLTYDIPDVWVASYRTDHACHTDEAVMAWHRDHQAPRHSIPVPCITPESVDSR